MWRSEELYTNALFVWKQVSIYVLSVCVLFSKSVAASKEEVYTNAHFVWKHVSIYVLFRKFVAAPTGLLSCNPRQRLRQLLLVQLL